MAHPYQQHKDYKVQRNRVGFITKGYASGGAVVPQLATGGAATAKARGNRDAMAVMGKPAAARLDKPMRGTAGIVPGRAKGGRTKGHKTNVNVIVAPHGGAMGGAPPVPAGMAPPSVPNAMPPVPPRPVGPPPMMGAAPPPGMPPGMPPMGPRSRGGRTYASGGAVKSGPAWNEGLKAGTPVQHTNGKMDGASIGRGKPITYKRGGAVQRKTGGPIYSKDAPMGPKFDGGSAGGIARIEKAKRAAGKYAKPVSSASTSDNR
jgi:hypothetical protein